MRAALVTILPMLTAAILVMVVGERVARREVEHRTPADRDRLLDYTDAFREELERLDAVYLGHLERISSSACFERPQEVNAAMAEIEGIKLVRVFRSQGQDSTFSPSMETGTLPEIELSGRKRPLNPVKALVLDSSLLKPPFPGDQTWNSIGVPGFQVHCSQPSPGYLVAILTDMERVNEVVAAHLEKWVTEPISPLLEAGERVQIEGPGERLLVSVGPEVHGPAASIIPIRSLSGHWQVRAWDGLVITRSNDAATLSSALILAVFLAGSGVLLFQQQRRALKLAAERVSFVNRVSHELGTPLTNLALNLDLAVEALAERPLESRRRLGIVSEEIERLARIVANVLTFSRRERDTLALKPVRCVPGEVIHRTLESFRPSLERRGIVVETAIEADDTVLMDPDALSQVVGNLISNVEKYGASGKWLHLSARMDAGCLHAEVRDRGPGIPDAARERIFEPFERVTDSTQEGASGTGLGLSIGRDLARKMGGSLDLVREGGETIFWLRVPAPPFLAILNLDAPAA